MWCCNVRMWCCNVRMWCCPPRSPACCSFRSMLLLQVSFSCCLSGFLFPHQREILEHYTCLELLVPWLAPGLVCWALTNPGQSCYVVYWPASTASDGCTAENSCVQHSCCRIVNLMWAIHTCHNPSNTALAWNHTASSIINLIRKPCYTSLTWSYCYWNLGSALLFLLGNMFYSIGLFQIN